jgi:small GTP-binding protein
MAGLPMSGIPRDARTGIKVILVGGYHVGKTCLMCSYLKQEFEVRQPTTAPGHVKHTVKRPDGSVVILEIWDTAGQERYAPISQLFIRNSDVALVCFDPSDADSMEKATDWAHRVAVDSPLCKQFGILTKADLYEPSEAAEKLEVAKVKFASLDFSQYFITSAKNREGVDQVFMAAAQFQSLNRPPAATDLALQGENAQKPCSC